MTEQDAMVPVDRGDEPSIFPSVRINRIPQVPTKDVTGSETGAVWTRVGQSGWPGEVGALRAVRDENNIPHQEAP